MSAKGKWIVALTGASGMRYALRLLEVSSTLLEEVHVVISEAGYRVLSEEEGIKTSPSRLNAKTLFGSDCSNCFFYNPKDIGASIASGSLLMDGMVIVPCSTGTCAAVANGLCQNLVQRAADVTLKEGRRLVIVPRETPLSPIQLENLLTLSRAGARVVPAMPGFYHQPVSIQDLIDMMVMKILDQMGLETNLVRRWGEGRERDTGRQIANSRTVRAIGFPSRSFGVIQKDGA